MDMKYRLHGKCDSQITFSTGCIFYNCQRLYIKPPACIIPFARLDGPSDSRTHYTYPYVIHIDSKSEETRRPNAQTIHVRHTELVFFAVTLLAKSTAMNISVASRIFSNIMTTQVPASRIPVNSG